MTDDTIVKPRVMYLDVDDTLLVWTNDTAGYAAPKSVEFLNWANEHFEIRWLTMWCMDGIMSDERAEELSYRFNYKFSPEQFKSIKNPKSFSTLKTEAIDFDDPRPWVWVEDCMLSRERMILQDKNMVDNFYYTNVSRNRVILQKTWRLLAQRFELPDGSTIPYATEMDMPIQLLSVDDIIEAMRLRKETNEKTQV